MELMTARLILREMNQGDFDDLKEMLCDPAVMYAYGHKFTDVDVQAWLSRQTARYREYGFGLWALVLRDTGEMIGQAGLTMQPYMGNQVLEIGYLLKQSYWRRGYAREAAARCKTCAFETLGREKVYSIIKSDNVPSIKVAESIGMVKEDEFITRYYGGDMLHFLYSVKN